MVGRKTSTITDSDSKLYAAERAAAERAAAKLVEDQVLTELEEESRSGLFDDLSSKFSLSNIMSNQEFNNFGLSMLLGIVQRCFAVVVLDGAVGDCHEHLGSFEATPNGSIVQGSVAILVGNINAYRSIDVQSYDGQDVLPYRQMQRCLTKVVLSA